MACFAHHPSSLLEIWLDRIFFASCSTVPPLLVSLFFLPSFFPLHFPSLLFVLHLTLSFSSPFLPPHLFSPHLSPSFLLSFPPSLLSSSNRAQNLLWISLRQSFQSTSHQWHSLLLTMAVHGPTSSYTGEGVSLITRVTLSSFMHMQKWEWSERVWLLSTLVWSYSVCSRLVGCGLYTYNICHTYVEMQTAQTKFTRFETVMSSYLNIHKRGLRQRCSSHFIRLEEKKVMHSLALT